MRLTACSFAILAFLVSPAVAQDCVAPCAGYEFSAELANDWIFAADPSSLKSNDLQPSLSSDFYFLPIENVKLLTSITTESVVDIEPGEDAAFTGIGTYVGELSASMDFEPVAVRFGKFDPAFSLASEIANGVNEDSLSSDIDVDERWGIEAALAYEIFGLQNSVVATAFTTDRTVLSESLFTNRGRVRLSDGGAGNTSGISSYALVFNGCSGASAADCSDEGDFGYRLAFRHQRAGDQTQDQLDEDVSPRSEQAYLASTFAKFDLNEDMTFRLAAEAAYLNHFEGDPDDALLLTGSAMIEQGQFKYIAAYTLKNNIIAAEPNTNEHLFDLEMVYTSEDDTPLVGADWQLAAAYTFAHDEDQQDSHQLSLRAEFNLAGSTGSKD